jgi:uncharacterized coiled-coil DUF342 family protein
MSKKIDVEQLLENVSESKRDEYRKKLDKYQENIVKCKELEKAYKTKHEEVRNMNELFKTLSDAMLKKFQFDVDIVSFYITLFEQLNSDDLPLDIDALKKEQKEWQDNLTKTMQFITDSYQKIDDQTLAKLKLDRNTISQLEGFSKLDPHQETDQETLDRLTN